MRFKLCTVEKDDKKKTAYIKEVDAHVGKVFNGWKILEVSINSINEEAFKKLIVKEKEIYHKL